MQQGAHLQVPFLASLQLRTIISLTPEFPVRQLVAFTRSSGIDFVSAQTGSAYRNSDRSRDTHSAPTGLTEIAALRHNAMAPLVGLETYHG